MSSQSFSRRPRLNRFFRAGRPKNRSRTPEAEMEEGNFSATLGGEVPFLKTRPGASAAQRQRGLLELLQLPVTGLGHRPAQTAEQVQRAVRIAARAVEHLLQVGARLRSEAHDLAARQARVRRSSGPVVALPGRLGGL